MRKLLLVALAVLLLSPIGFKDSVVSANTTDSYMWRNVKIGGGGFVPGIIYNPAQNGLLYARTDVGGSYRFNPATKIWTPLMDSVGRTSGSDMGVFSMAVDPTDANKVYMLTGMYTSPWGSNANFYASSNQGATWTKTPLPFKVGGNEYGRNTGERLQVDPNLTTVLYMGTTTDGLYKSIDSGASWNKVSSFPATYTNFVILDSSSSSPGTATSRIIVGTKGTSNTMYISNDGGSTWSAISQQPSGFCPMRADIAAGKLYIAYSAFEDISLMPGPGGASNGAVYSYNINTGSWTNITPAGQSGWGGFGSISVDRQNPNHILTATINRWSRDNIFQSFDGGSTWTDITGTHSETQAPYAGDNPMGWTSDIKIDPNNSNKAIFSFGGGVYMTDSLTSNPVAWSYEINGIEEAVPLELKSPPSGTNLFSAMGDIGSFKFDNLTVSPPNGDFNPGHNGSNWSIDFAESVPAKIVRSFSEYPHAAYSVDGGATWTSFASLPPNIGLGGHIAISADGSKIVWTPRYANESYMAPYVSSNNGSSWTASSGGVIGIKPVADRVNSNKFYQFDYPNGKVYVSTDGGASFTVGATGLPAVPGYSPDDADLQAVFGKEGHLWAATGAGGLYYSTDSGMSFTKVSAVTTAYSVGFGKAASAGGYPAVYLNGIVDGSLGIFRSDDQGASWVQINDAQHQYSGRVTGDPKVYGRVYVAAGARGIIYGDKMGIQSGHVYQLINKYSGKSIDVLGSSTSTAAEVVQNTSSDISSQKWKVDDLGNGYYKLTNVNSSQVMDVNQYSPNDGAGIIQYPWSSGGGDNEQWQIVDNGGGYYKILNKYSGKALEVKGFSTANGSNTIDQWTWSGGDNQQWSLVYLY
jgi:hypothetical protein